MSVEVSSNHSVNDLTTVPTHHFFVFTPSFLSSRKMETNAPALLSNDFPRLRILMGVVAPA